MNADTFEVRRAPFSAESLVARLRAAVPDVAIVASELLTDYDSYYYSRGRQTPLPVLRVKFADPAETWVYVDPGMSQVLAQIPRLARVERWLSTTDFTASTSRSGTTSGRCGISGCWRFFLEG